MLDSTTTHTYDYLRDAGRVSVDHGTVRESGGPMALQPRWSAVRPSVERA